MAQHRGSPPQQDHTSRSGSRQVETEQGHSRTLAESLARLTAVLNASEHITATVETRPVVVFGRRWIVLGRTAAPRPTQRVRIPARPRERRSAHGRSRRTSTSRDDGSAPGEPPLARHPRWGLCSPNLLRLLEAVAR